MSLYELDTPRSLAVVRDRKSAIQAHIKHISRLRRHQLSAETMKSLEGWVGDADQMPLIDFLTIAVKGNKVGVRIAKGVMAREERKLELADRLRRKLGAKKAEQ